MKYLLRLVYLGMMSAVLTLQAACQAPSKVDSLSKEQLQVMLKEDRVLLLDVRTPEEVAEGMIPGAIHMDYYGSSFMGKLKELDKGKPIVIYCRSGQRAGKALNALKKLGHKELYNFGGYDKWIAE